MDKGKIFPYTSRKDTTFYTRCSLGMAHSHLWPTIGFMVYPYYSLHWQCQCPWAVPWAVPTVIVISKNITRRWQIGKIFHYHLCKASTISQKGGRRGRYARIIHAPTICLGQKWQRTQVGKKAILVHNEVRHHTSRGPGSFLFWGGWGCWIFVVPSVYSLCSNQDLNGFPTCSSSSQ
jgi:hypothetical protein